MKALNQKLERSKLAVSKLSTPREKAYLFKRKGISLQEKRHVGLMEPKLRQKPPQMHVIVVVEFTELFYMMTYFAQASETHKN